jgi:acetylornithine deacetylase
MTALEIAQELVRIPSVNPAYDPDSPGEAPVVDWLEDWGRANGLEPIRQPSLAGRDNISFTIRNGGGSHLLLNGHTDTVSIAGMTIEPYGGEIRDGRLWGRGATDMKGPLAAMLGTLLQMRDRDNWSGALTVGCVVDEEYKYRGILSLLDANEPWDFAVVGEPTTLKVVRGCKGSCRFTVHTEGRATHSSRPGNGVNAIVGMAKAIPAMAEYFENELAQFAQEGFGPSTGSIGLIEGGSGINIVPDRCTISIDMRTVPGQDWRVTLAELESHVRDRCGDLGDVRLVFDDPGHFSPGFETADDHPLVRAACEVVGDAETQLVPFGCDGSKISARDIPTIVLGPGDIAQAHTKDEFISLADLEAGADAYLNLAQTLLKKNAD